MFYAKLLSPAVLSLVFIFPPQNLKKFVNEALIDLCTSLH